MTLETNAKSATEILREKYESVPASQDFLKQMTRFVADESPEFSYLSRILKYPRLSLSEIANLLDQIGKEPPDEKKTRKKLAESHLVLVAWIAKDYYHQDIPFLDLINEGTVAMVSAVNIFNPLVDSDFPEHLVLKTQKAISQFVKEETNSKQLPNALIEKLSSIKSIARKLEEKLGTEPTRAQIAKAMDISEEELERLIGLAKAKEETEESQDSEGQEALEGQEEQDYENYVETEYEEPFENDDDED